MCRKVKYVQSLYIYLNLIMFDIQLRVFGFENVFEKYVKYYQIKNRKESITSEEIDEVSRWMKMIDKACASYPFEAQCLHRSFLAYRFIRMKFFIPVELVIGVKKFPFHAHAWLKLKDKNFNESPEYTDGLIIILNSEEGKAML